MWAMELALKPPIRLMAPVMIGAGYAYGIGNCSCRGCGRVLALCPRLPRGRPSRPAPPGLRDAGGECRRVPAAGASDRRAPRRAHADRPRVGFLAAFTTFSTLVAQMYHAAGAGRYAT